MVPEKMYRKTLSWFDFHLSSFNRVVITLPVIPVHTVSKGGMFAFMIEAIQVGIVTGSVPPSSLVILGTVSVTSLTRVFIVVVSIFGGKRHATMIRKRVTSSS